jgi:hypothetical protein
MKIKSVSGEFSVNLPKLGTFVVIPAIENLEFEAEESQIQAEVFIAKKDKRRVGGGQYHVRIKIGDCLTRVFPLSSEQVRSMLNRIN